MTNAASRGVCRAASSAIIAAAVFLTISSSPAHASFIGLGQAGNYVMFDVSNSQWQMNNATSSGDMAAGPGTTYNWSGGAGPYSGIVYYQTGGTVPPVNNLGGTPKPTTSATDLMQAVLDARVAAASAASLTANLVVSGNQITNTTGTITGNGPGSENVIDLTQVNMTNGTVLINGTASEDFIFRVSGQFNVGNSSIRATGGVTPDHILWYISGTNQTVKSPNGAWDGTILALNSGVSFDNTPSGLGACRGADIAADDVNNNQPWVFSTVSGFDINYAPFTSPPGVPEPSTFVLAGLGVCGAFVLRRMRRAVISA
jgi:PEP-CTERM motif